MALVPLIAALLLAMFLSAGSASVSADPTGFEKLDPGAFEHTGPSPTPRPSDGRARLLGPAQPGGASAEFRYLFTQPDSDVPVAYDPCRSIKVVVNNRTAPAGAIALVDQAIAEVSRASGLRMEVEGTTDEEVSDDRPAFIPERYGDRWAPVLIGWTDPARLSGLEGDSNGEAGSWWVKTADARSPRAYVSGTVGLDGPQMQEILNDEVDGAAIVKATVMHELAHLLGLDHVNNRSELMYPESLGVNELQLGDRNGLAALGQGACISSL